LVTAVAGILFLQEGLTAGHVFGGLLILGGIALTSKRDLTRQSRIHKASGDASCRLPTNRRVSK